MKSKSMCANLQINKEVRLGKLDTEILLYYLEDRTGRIETKTMTSHFATHRGVA
jgi:hypothetical protein